MTTEVRLFSAMGIPLADVNVIPVASHIINDVGDASFTISREAYAAKEKFIQFGNVLLIRHDQLPAWVGFIDPTQGREWGAGDITIKALSAEVIFNRRIVFPTPLIGTTGAIFRTLLNNIGKGARGGIKIFPGDIWMGGRINRYPLLGRARDVLDRVSKKGKCDWSVTHQIVQGRLVLYANLYQGERGAKKSRVLDARNTELISPLYTEQGEIWNHVVFMKPPSEQGGGRISSPQRDEKSISKYGLYEYLGETNVDDETAIEWQAKAWLYDHAYPRGMCTPTILNHNNTFDHIGMGNVYRWENHAVEFQGGLINSGGDVRLTAFEVNYDTERVGATVESTTKPFDISQLFNM
jgi:hypothetical protein